MNTPDDDEFGETKELFVHLAAAMGTRDQPNVEHEPAEVPPSLIDAARFYVAVMRADKQRAVESAAADVEYVEFVAALVEGGWRIDGEVLEQASRAISKAATVRSRAATLASRVDYVLAKAEETLAAMDHALRSAHRHGHYLTYQVPQITISANLHEIGQTRTDIALQNLLDGLGEDESGKDIA